ncbi:hypothetical protein AJ78_05644 [Emergomyces pasteurianus Ep9510]|uniref:DUF6314 domain-containing protein n=1 Tax=Emergomyces pasteurianus Ep9510 TaxID=1447872 RepID=A0A1J9QFJ6_9EURO|nr:hypothetical protein AJ78_05644 [Emergomyces pasteurianus Ep9510]
MSKYVASRIFSSLTDPRPWALSRTLRSDNPADLNGELKGTATFVLNNTSNTPDGIRDMLYSEEGEMPGVGGSMAALRWTRKYIWRLSPSSFLTADEAGDIDITESPVEQADGEHLSVWFVKLQKPASDSQRGKEGSASEIEEAITNEVDYIFHELDIIQFDSTHADESLSANAIIQPPPPPPPPPAVEESNTKVVIARGQHLCINDHYQTVYAFRMGNDAPGRILSWSSRHMIRGPKKSQEIVNLYSRDD